jgi:hypothetical protein
MKPVRTLVLALVAAILGVGCGVVAPVPAPDEGSKEQPEHSPPPPGEPYGTATDHVLVKPLLPQLLDELLGALGAESLGAVPGTGFYKVRLPTGRTPAGFVSELEGDLRVVAAALDIGLAAPEGNGLTIPAGGILLSVELPMQPELTRIGIDAAHARASGAGVMVAVLDSGVIPEHAFLAGRLLAGGWDFVSDDDDPREETNGIDDDENGFVDEGWGHGTFVSSLVLAVAPDARVLPLRVLGTDLFGTSSAVAAAITYAANAGVDVIHLSVELPPQVAVVRDAIQTARALGAVVIGAAGNTGDMDATHRSGPDAAFLVTAIDDQNMRAPFATYGSGVALSAPGVDMHGAYPTQDPDTAIWSGTSFGAPIASGAFALAREAFPLLTPDQILQRLKNTAVDVDAQNPDVAGMIGAGRIDLDAATAP